MKIRTISRLEEDYTRSSKKDIYRICRNFAPELHPFEKAREYTRALNATKLERIFAKPFVSALNGHKDGVFCMAKNPLQIQSIISGACNGEVKIWNLSTMTCKLTIDAHQGYVRGLCVNPQGDRFLTCSEDTTIKKWSIENGSLVNVWTGAGAVTSISHHQRQNLFATGGTFVRLWDEDRSEPTANLTWDSATESIVSVQFNPVEVNILASSGSDRSICLHDVRIANPIKKLILSLRTNAISWNPIEAYNFTSANEDGNCYSYDMRRLDQAVNVHKDHVAAVLSVDYSPTGREFVTGSYDRTVRIFGHNRGHSREIYHTRRMQRVFSVLWSLDTKFILSGSDETNLRVWKAKADEKLGTICPREKAALAYAEKLKDKYQHHPEIKRIARHRHIPKAVKKAHQTKNIMIASQKRREANRIKQTKESFPKERQKNIVTILE